MFPCTVGARRFISTVFGDVGKRFAVVAPDYWVVILEAVALPSKVHPVLSPKFIANFRRSFYDPVLFPWILFVVQFVNTFKLLLEFDKSE